MHFYFISLKLKKQQQLNQWETLQATKSFFKLFIQKSLSTYHVIS